MSEKNNLSEKIILNVGGFKYETLRSTLTAYPDTFLGTMFADRNQQLLKPVNDNEYFFDRNGRAFHYIMEYYRTGKQFFPKQLDEQNFWVTKEEVETEFNYFLINASDTTLEQHLKTMHLIVSEHLNKLVALIEEKIMEKMRKSETVIYIRICSLKEDVNNTFSSFPSFEHESAYRLASNFHPEISRHLKNKLEGSSVASNINYYDKRVEFCVIINYNKKFIIDNSNIKSSSK
ncbi:6063_t:CDS:2 [Ambispora leptoticha]|uniref:6063_t:CDS:1 n=1 Tax=Ambispora leptoticha TaxID=144679 RepID=A0A9N9CAP3_9GLOM|nr:6063_t:CDS:2 [Ambispora leptoticha]